MSNKASDKNVGSIEEDVDELKSIMNLRTVSGFAYSQKNTLSLQKAIKNVLTDYTRQKQINEEHQKLNGELRERVKELEEENKNLKAQHIFTRNNNATDKEKAELYDVIDKTIDTFLEQEKPIWQQEMIKDKMSLEEALSIVDEMYQNKYKIIEKNNTIYVDKLNDIKFTSLEFASVRLLREVQSLQYKLENSIPKQVVIDEVKRLKNMLKATTEGILQKYTVEEIIIKINTFEELLEDMENGRK